MQPCLPFMLTWCADFRVDAVNDLLNIPCPLHNHLHSSSFFVMCCSLVQAWIMLYVQSCCMAWPATVTCIRWKKQHEKQLTACDCELVLEAEGCTLGNPAYSLRSTSSCLLLLFLCHVQPACLFSLIPLPLFFIFFFHLSICAWSFIVHGCVGIWSMWPLRRSCAWNWCEVQVWVCWGIYCLFWLSAAL